MYSNLFRFKMTTVVIRSEFLFVRMGTYFYYWLKQKGLLCCFCSCNIKNLNYGRDQQQGHN